MIRAAILHAVVVIALAFPSFAGAADPPPKLDPASAARFAALALTCLHQEYPNKISHTMKGDADARAPRELTPAFFGCYDWHSAVHGHWLLVRLARLYPDAAFARTAREELGRSFTPPNIAAEVVYLERPDRASFERPYGLAWLLQLSAELRGWDDPQARQWATTLSPLETAAAKRLKTWLPKLRYPIRVGEHSQTAFAFGLVWDWARVSGDGEMRTLLESAGRRFYRNDKACPLAYEPSGEDFLSPCLAEADFMRRVLDRGAFTDWLAGFLPEIPGDAGKTWLGPGIVTDRSDPKLAHIDGLNLSRAWMLEGIAQGLSPDDRRVPALLAAATRHREAALPAVTGEHYEGGHWLGTFAVYLTSGAGLTGPAPTPPVISRVEAAPLLACSIAYHDPGNRWPGGAFEITDVSERPDGGAGRTTKLRVDNGRGRSDLEIQIDGHVVTAAIHDDTVEAVRLDGRADFSPEERERYQLSPVQVLKRRNFFLYLLGLPMKLRDPGTRLDPTARVSVFQGAPVHELRVTYDESVGGDTWFFYLDPGSCALVGHRFHHVESTRDGEYAVLSGEVSGLGLKLPRIRKWHRNVDDQWFITHTIRSIEAP